MGILLLVFGVGAAGWGAMFLFDLRGATGKAVARRNAVRAVTGARNLDLRLTEPSRLGAWFFRVVGGIGLLGGLFLGFIGLALTLAE
ncbi:hypothetical protein VO63_30570 [Streptomyces showdoensis]|uniref:Uncharacterized protein n=1 Tax=Streptomyces showdoensis TaxID=68268 RepID=A0A2P2GF75_STREW|nr:hypothetical protein VO63_30570 [Streptomyces showdoensis]